MNGKAIIINKKDNVAIATCQLKAGERISFKHEIEGEIEIKNDIQFGHKFALTDIERGDVVIKYGEVIGIASKKIDKGGHVHVHNLESIRGRGDLNIKKKV